jgi:hypothetical protein
MGTPTPVQPPTPGAVSSYPGARPRSHQLTTAAIEANQVPMLMYSKDLKNRIEEIKQQRKVMIIDYLINQYICLVV